MRQHVIFLMLIVVSLYFVSTYENEVQKLMTPVPITQSGKAGVQDVLFNTEQYEPTAELVDGAFTVLYFHTDSCPGCRRLNSDLKRFIQVRPDVVVRRFDLGYQWSSVNAYNTYGLRINKTPFIHIYGPDGSLIAEDVGTGSDAFDLLYEWMNAELKQVWERKRTG
jgi:hypothetical protein